MSFTFLPYAGERELRDPDLAGEFASELAGAAGEGHEPWCTYIARIDGVPVGSGMFKCAPDEQGTVEIGYLTFMPARRRGVAAAMASALVVLASHHGAKVVAAETLPEEIPSTKVLRAAGFVQIGNYVHPDDGPVWRWERAFAPSEPPRWQVGMEGNDHA